MKELKKRNKERRVLLSEALYARNQSVKLLQVREWRGWWRFLFLNFTLPFSSSYFFFFLFASLDECEGTNGSIDSCLETGMIVVVSVRLFCFLLLFFFLSACFSCPHSPKFFPFLWLLFSSSRPSLSFLSLRFLCMSLPLPRSLPFPHSSFLSSISCPPNKKQVEEAHSAQRRFLVEELVSLFVIRRVNEDTCSIAGLPLPDDTRR